jgi:arginyl-tRNA synthetase
MIIDEVRRVLALAAQVNESELVLEHPDLEMHGDYSTNIALVKKGGRKLAEEIAARVEIGGLIEKVEVAGGGFINIWLSKNYLIDGLGGYANVEKKDHRKIMFEFGQPNTHKMPHVGHLYSYIYGESCCRLLEATGVQVRRVNYQGDVGMHVAKCMWAWARSGSDVPDGLEEKVNLLQKMYQMGSKAYEEDESAKKEINEINKIFIDLESQEN